MPPLHDAKRQCTAFFVRVTRFEPVIFPALDFAAAFFTAEFARVYFLCVCVFFHEKTPKSQTKTVKHKLKQKDEFWMDFVLLILILLVFSRIISQLLFD